MNDDESNKSHRPLLCSWNIPYSHQYHYKISLFHSRDSTFALETPCLGLGSVSRKKSWLHHCYLSRAFLKLLTVLHATSSDGRSFHISIHRQPDMKKTVLQFNLHADLNNLNKWRQGGKKLSIFKLSNPLKVSCAHSALRPSDWRSCFTHSTQVFRPLPLLFCPTTS